MFRTLILLAVLAIAMGFTPFSHRMGFSLMQRRSSVQQEFSMKLGEDEKICVIGVAADSGCGKSTFMRRLTKVFGGSQVGPLGGGFGNGGWETNTLVSDKATVICLDDYHANDREGRKVSGLTALNLKEQNFKLMGEQLSALKSGNTIAKPIYNHVNGTLDAPETVEPTPIVIIEGLHPLADETVRSLLDFTIYLDISDEIKFAWKIQRDMAERGWTEEQVKADIEKRKPDFAAFVAPQMEFSDIVISVLPSEVNPEPKGKFLKVKLIQKLGKDGLPPATLQSTGPSTDLSIKPVCASESSEIVLKSYKDKYYGNDVQVIEMDGKVTDLDAFCEIEKYLGSSGAKTESEVSDALKEVGAGGPGSLDGTGLFQTITALKLRDYYDYVTK